ncbi:MAG: GDSL-like Lipase/Acylhydrolase [Firmicutes bacterium ADurb.BinA205]|nr:MAG: GDSL-like Lipase/Acylhydrolase [Firmicutes bacterium ADurb.BinA205]
MPVYVIDTLKPKNGLDFPVVEAIDVAVEGYSSLADAVSNFATRSALDALYAVLNTKADTSALTGATTSLQAQIDQIAQAAGTGTADTEVAQARVRADGTSYQTLKGRLDAEKSDSDAKIAESEKAFNALSDTLANSFESEKTDLEYTFTDSKYINSQGDIVNTYSSSEYGVSNYIDVSDYSYLSLYCVSGFENGFYAFYDSSYQFISGVFAESGANRIYAGNAIVPINAKYIVITGKSDDLPQIGVINKLKVAGYDELSELTLSVAGKSVGLNLLNPDELEDGYLDANGDIVPNAGSRDWLTTGFIEVGDKKNIAASKSGTSGREPLPIHFIVEYDSDLEILNYTQLGSNDGLFTLGSTSKFFRLAYHATGTSEPMIFYGTDTHTAYEEYHSEYKVKKDALPNDTLDELSVLSDNIAPVFSSVGTLDITANKLISGNKSKVVDYNNTDYTVATYELDGTYAQLAITASANFDNLFYIITDENNTTINISKRAESGSGITKITNEIVNLPPAGRYLIVANVYSEQTPVQVISTIYNGLEASSISENLRTEISEMITEESAPKHLWEGKKWVCVGDSLTEVNSRTTKHYHDYIAESTGITVINMGINGTGYKREEGNNNAFYQRIVNVPTDADVVTIFGSGNDLALISDLGTPSDTGTETICGCINTTIDNLIALIPAVSLGIVAPTPWINNQPTLDDSNSMARYTEALREICKIRSIPFLDLYHCSNLRPWTAEGRAACYSKDDGNGVHPDETGHKLIAPRFKAFLDNLIL